MTEQNEFFEVADTSIAAWLLSHRIPYRGAVLSGDGFAVSRFKNDGRITELIDGYNAGDACSAKDFSANYRFLNNQIHQARRNAERVQ